MKNRYAALLRMAAALLCAVLLPALAIADGAGVLSENELNTWISQLLRDSLEETPMNAPVGEESLTEDGYAFLYSFATLYYDKPVLDQNSVLQAIALADDQYPSPRGIRVGSEAAALMESYGWQNPMLLGDGSSAALYRLDNLPDAAYWSLARHENGSLLSVRCAMHVRVSDGRYTDAGVEYALEGGKVSGVRVYGLNALISERDVRSNLNAVAGVEAAISGDAHEDAGAAEGYFGKSDQAPFAVNDLLFGGVNYLNFTEADAKRLFGAAKNESRVEDDTGAWLLTTERDGLTLSYTESADGTKTALDALSVTGALKGPRGVCVGMTKAEALGLFQSDGEGKTLGSANVLYGDGVNAPTGLLEEDGAGATLRYSVSAQTANGLLAVTLHMTFTNDLMSEWMLYSW